MECGCGNKGKYKCPACSCRYCSAACCKVHRERCEGVEVLEKKQKIKEMPRNFLLEDEDDIVIEERVFEKMSKRKIGNSQRLREILKNKEVQDILKNIDKSENRLGALRSVLALDKEGISVVSECFDLMLKTTGFLNEEGVSSL